MVFHTKRLKFTGLDGAETLPVGATSKYGIIGTCRGNAGGWAAMQNSAPFGDWELALPDTGEMRNRFKNEEIMACRTPRFRHRLKGGSIAPAFLRCVS
jgi:hypothetical protein